MAVPMISVEGQLIVKYWPPEHLDEDDYVRRANEEMELSSVYDNAIARLEESKNRVSEMSSGKAADATKSAIEKTISGLSEDSAKSKASAGNLALRGQSMFNLKNILNSIAWGLHNFKAKVLAFFFGDPITATAAVETAEAAAEAASGTAKASDEVAETVTTENVMKGLEVLTNRPDMLAPIIEDLGPGDNITAEMEGAEAEVSDAPEAVEATEVEASAEVEAVTETSADDSKAADDAADEADTSTDEEKKDDSSE